MRAMAVKKPALKSPRLRALTLRQLTRQAAMRLRRANLCHANGLQDPFLEAEYLVCHALSVPLAEADAAAANSRVTPAERRAAWDLIGRRIRTRLPAPYLTREAFFAGQRYYVDERVLIPRSCIENIFDDPDGFSPWLDPARVRRVLDLGTGSGCLAVALATAFPRRWSMRAIFRQKPWPSRASTVIAYALAAASVCCRRICFKICSGSVTI